jgi:hypothetical protein
MLHFESRWGYVILPLQHKAFAIPQGLRASNVHHARSRFWPTNLSKALAACMSRSEYRSRYRSAVIAIVECPSRLLMTSRGTPAIAKRLACVSRSPCKVISVTPDRLMQSSAARPKFQGSFGLPSALAKTRPASLYAPPRKSRSAACCALCDLKIAQSVLGVEIVLVRSFFGALNSMCSVTDRAMFTLRSSKFTSCQRSAKTSPLRAPVYAAKASPDRTTAVSLE